jgi:hypothetical protein
MNEQESQLWRSIHNFELDDEDSVLSFSRRLGRENGWTIEFSLRAIEEYKRFMFLIAIANHPLTPSDEVDQVWHLHLIYTQSYWKGFCSMILNKEIHHGPTKGGEAEGNKFNDWYSKTLEFYQTKFGHEPPSDIWPSPAHRFRRADFKRIDTRANWIIKRLF